MSKEQKDLQPKCEFVHADVTIKSVGYPHPGPGGYENEILLQCILPSKVVELVGKKSLDWAFRLAKLQGVSTNYIESDSSYEVLLNLPFPEITERKVHLFKDFIGTSIQMAHIIKDYKDVNLEFAKGFDLITPSKSNEPTSEQCPEGECNVACTDEEEVTREQLYRVKLLSVGDQKLRATKTIHELCGLSLKEAKDLVDLGSGYVIINATKKQAIIIKNALEVAGTTAIIEAEDDNGKDTESN